MASPDYDGDGWPDIYFTNAQSVDMALHGVMSRSALFHNNHDGTFTDVTDKAGVGYPCWAMGAVVGDCNSDDRLRRILGHHRLLLIVIEGVSPVSSRRRDFGSPARGTQRSRAVFELGSLRPHRRRFSLRSRGEADYFEESVGVSRRRRISHVVDWPGCSVTIPVSMPFHSLPKGSTKLNWSSTATKFLPCGE
jgi:hypothetical protein